MDQITNFILSNRFLADFDRLAAEIVSNRQKEQKSLQKATDDAFYLTNNNAQVRSNKSHLTSKIHYKQSDQIYYLQKIDRL